jgi:hypothetical protein
MYLSKSFILVSFVTFPKPSSSLFYFYNGDEGSRTLDLWLAKPALSQLSYVPEPLQSIIDS